LISLLSFLESRLERNKNEKREIKKAGYKDNEGSKNGGRKCK
jgi:hypothetical protein